MGFVRDNRRALAVLAALVVGYLLVPQLLPDEAAGPKPTSREAEQLGWVGPDEDTAREIAVDLFARVNDERAARGLPSLDWDERLADIAGRWSLEMLVTGTYEHSPEAFREHPAFAGTGENILMMYEGAEDAHVGWMESDGHRASILGPQYTAVGIGVVCRNDGRLWATQVFGVPAQPPPPRQVDAGPDPVVRDDAGPRCPQTRTRATIPGG